MNFSEILTFVRQRIKKLPESPFLHIYIFMSFDDLIDFIRVNQFFYLSINYNYQLHEIFNN
jgi:hypothetical protein